MDFTLVDQCIFFSPNGKMSYYSVYLLHGITMIFYRGWFNYNIIMFYCRIVLFSVYAFRFVIVRIVHNSAKFQIIHALSDIDRLGTLRRPRVPKWCARRCDDGKLFSKMATSRLWKFNTCTRFGRAGHGGAKHLIRKTF